MSERDELVEVMALELSDIRCRRAEVVQKMLYIGPEKAMGIADGILLESRNDARQIVAAAERAGFRWLEKDDGR